MNDFTKEELEFIWQRLAVLDCHILKGFEELPNKIYFMVQEFLNRKCPNPECKLTIHRSDVGCYK